MTIIYTPQLDKAIYMASCLGGISYFGKIVKHDTLDEHKAEIIIDAKRSGHITTSLSGTDYVFIWGDNLLRIANPASFGFTGTEKEGFFPPFIRFEPAAGKEAELEHVMTILRNTAHKQIYVAAGDAHGRSRFAMLYSYADIDRKVFFLDINDFSPEGILKSLGNPLAETSKGILCRTLTHQHIYYVANVNMPKFLPGFSAYPMMKEIPILKKLADRADEIDLEKTKDKYSISIEGVTSSGKSLALSSKKASFTTKEELDAFIKAIPHRTCVSIKSEFKEIPCPGPHSEASLIREAAEKFNYSPEETRNVLSSLADDGLILNITGNKRCILKEHIPLIENIVRNAAGMVAFHEVLENCDSPVIEPSKISYSKEYGIIPTDQIPGYLLDTAEKRNIYFLILRETLKLVLGKCKIRKSTVYAAINGNTYSASGSITEDRGWTVLDSKKQASDFPEDLKDGDTIELRYAADSKITHNIKPYTEAEIRSSFTDPESDVFFTSEELGSILSSLERKKLISKKGQNIFPTAECRKMMRMASDYGSICEAPVRWERILNQIASSTDTDTMYSLREDITLQVKNEIIEWIHRIEAPGKKVNIPCPCCSERLSSSESGLSCAKCGYKIDRIQYGRAMNDDEFYYLVQHRTTPLLRDFIVNGEYTYGRIFLDETYRITFTEDSTHKCPICGEYLRVKEKLYTCSSCGYGISPEAFGYTLRYKEFSTLLTDGKIRITEKFRDPDGKLFDGLLFLDRSKGCEVCCIRIAEEKSSK